jgi:hypothetical protein
MRRVVINLISVPVVLAGCLAGSAVKPPAQGGPPTTANDLGAARGDLGAPRGGDMADGGASASCQPSWTVTPTCGGGDGNGVPDFGPNVLIFDPSQSAASIQGQLDNIYTKQDGAQFGSGRYAFLFKPGNYNLDVRVGFYTEALGLGQSPDAVVINGAVRAKADWFDNNHNATLNFWRGAENLAIVPSNIDGGPNIWAVSQGTHLRRIHVRGDIKLDDGGWSSGGFIADSLVDGTTDSGTQQQFLTRNVDQNWTGHNWNMVFVGDGNPPAVTWHNPPYTVAPTTPVVREKPFLYVDDAGKYYVMVPALKNKSKGHSWASGAPPGLPLSIDRFYVAKPGTDTATTLNAALAQGKHLLFTPGIYHLDDSLQVARPNTILLGIGLATLIPDKGTQLISVGDVDGVTVAGLLLAAGPTTAPTLLQIGSKGSANDHSMNPTALFDVHCRIGGASAGTVDSCVTLNSSQVIVDNTWLWRADHGAGAPGWTSDLSKNGLIVNGNDVTIYGLFVEHFQQYQTVWNGNNGAVYLYQSEMPYDPPDQSSWQASPGHNGYPSYKVGDSVTSHHAVGLGVYSVFSNDVTADNAIETPSAAGVTMSHMVTVSLAAGSITHIINGSGGSVGTGNMVAYSSN